VTDSCPLEIDQLSKTFDPGLFQASVRAVRGASFSVREGEIFGLVGPNGAGKTTIMKMVTGLIHPDDGHISLLGEDHTSIEPRRHLGYLPEGPYFYEYLTPVELLHLYGSLHNMSRSDVDAVIDELLRRVGIWEAKDRPLREFSKGMRQRAGLAQALINDPDLLIFDEPQSGLDPVGRREVRQLMTELNDEGKTIIFSSHVLSDVEAVCDRVAVMNDGEVVSVTDLDDPSLDVIDYIEVTLESIAADKLDLDTEPLDIRSETAYTSLRFRPDANLNAILESLLDSGATIRDVTRHRPGLEELFIEETGAETESSSAPPAANTSASQPSP
jgi:ABC-2 type transport system ATP-binding protein